MFNFICYAISMIASLIIGPSDIHSLKIVENLKSLFTYPASMSLLLIFYSYLFKFRSAEIQIDKNAMSVEEVINKLRNLKNCFRAAISSFIALKIIMMVFFFIANLVALIL